MAAKKSVNGLNEFHQRALYFIGNPARTNTKAGKKFKYALERVADSLATKVSKFNTELAIQLEELQIDLAMTDAEGAILYDAQGRYKTTPANQKLLKRAVQKHRDEVMAVEDIEVESYLAKVLPPDLSREEIKAFSGFVIDPTQAEELIKAMDEKEEARFDDDAEEEVPTVERQG